MLHEDPGDIKYGDIGGLGEQIRELREVIELPLINPQLFLRVGIKPPKGTTSWLYCLSSLNVLHLALSHAQACCCTARLGQEKRFWLAQWPRMWRPTS